MERVFKIWILSLVSIGLIYLAFTNRYAVVPGSNMKYDRWMTEISQLKQNTEVNKPWEKLENREKLQNIIKLKELINKSDELKAQQLSRTRDWLDKIQSQQRENWAVKYTGEFDFLTEPNWATIDSLDKKIDSLFKEAIYLNRQCENLLIIQRLSTLISDMQKELKSQGK